MPKQRATLTYDPDSELLHGTAGGKSVSIKAASGGHRANTSQRETDAEHISMDPKNKGAVIPAGTYEIFWLGKYKVYSQAAFLKPDATAKKFATDNGRKWNDFLIHGPGKVGSEGCVVPYSSKDFKTLMGLLKGKVNESVGILTVQPVKGIYLPPITITASPKPIETIQMPPMHITVPR